MSGPIVRPRRPDDLPALADVLGEQQPASRYPFRWPLPFGVREFLVRDDEQAAWVAEVDGAVVGHVSVCAVGAGEPGDTFRTATGCADPAVVSVLFTATRVRGLGVGGRLLDTATAWAGAHGRVPVLDVVVRPTVVRDGVVRPGGAQAVYEHLGWVPIGSHRFDWLPDDEPDVLLMALPPFPVVRPG